MRRGPIREEQRLSGEVVPTYRFVVAPRVPGRDLARLQTLEERQLIARSEVERARAIRDALVSRQTLARAQIEQREAALSSARIR